MESIEKLRNLPTFSKVKVDGELTPTKMLMVYATKEQILEIADAIEAEIAEKYMLLPVDADGVPIHPGDELVYRGHEPFVCRAVSEKHAHTWDAAACAIGHLGIKCVHVKPRTVEDVLWDALNEYDKGELSTREIAVKYAAELRMVDK